MPKEISESETTNAPVYWRDFAWVGWLCWFIAGLSTGIAVGRDIYGADNN